MKLIVHVLVLILAFNALADLPIPKFRNAPFRVRPVSGMYRIGDLQLSGLPTGIQIAAYGDFNNDKYTDFVSISDNRESFTVFVYVPSTAAFENYTTFAPENQQILSIVPADYNYDGLLDIMAVLSGEGQGSYASAYFHTSNFPYFQLQDSIQLYYDQDELIHPFIVDLDGNRWIDIFYIDDLGNRKITSFMDTSTVKDFSDYTSTANGCIDPSSVSSLIFATPHSNAFVDFNGDCAADLFITSQDQYGNLYFEIWLRRTTDESFCLVDLVNITLNGVSSVSIGDMDNDGRLDLVYMDTPDDPSLPMNLHVVYNTFPTNPSTPCSLTDPTMRSPFDPSAYNAQQSIANTTYITQVTPITTSLVPNARLFSPDPINRPPKIRLGDVNIDGFLDILLVIVNAETQNPISGFTLLGINQGKGNGFVVQDETVPLDLAPYFTVITNATKDSSISELLITFPTLYASFFDFDEKGSLGFWMTVPVLGRPSTIMAVYNFVSTPNFILKALGLNGVLADSGNVLDSLGGIYPGASVECIVNDVKGNARIAKAAQLGQTAYTALDLPYAFIGLGRTNNYVQDFSMGISQNLDDSDDLQQTSWTPIIPNSQLIVNTLINDDWTLDVYVNPISQTMLVVVITLAILFLLAIIILVLHLRERKEDQKNEQKFYVFG